MFILSLLLPLYVVNKDSPNLISIRFIYMKISGNIAEGMLSL